jgi:hypothetical protein
VKNLTYDKKKEEEEEEDGGGWVDTLTQNTPL